MKKYDLISILSLPLCLLTVVNFAQAAKEVKVQIHTVKGSGITEQQVRDWIKKTNQADSNHASFVVDSNHLYEPNTPYDPKKNDANKVNIWVRKKCAVTGEPNYVSGQKGNIIELVPGTSRPAGPNDPNVFIKDSTLAHELNHLLGLEHSNDPNNKMYPDNSTHGGTKPAHSCHRVGIIVTLAQFTAIDATVTKLANKATERGNGKDLYDFIADVSFNYIDLDWSQAWLEWSGMYFLNLIVQVGEISFTEFSQIGFYIDADNDPATGMPPEGLDYYIAYQPNINQVIYQIYSFGVWLPLDTAPISYQLMYTDKDMDTPQNASGVKMSIPVPLMPLAMGQNYISLKAAASNIAETDFLPDTGLVTFRYPPQWQPDFVPDGQIDFRDLRLMANSWLESPSDPNIDLYYDGNINFRDFTEFGNHWRQVQSLP